MFSGPTAAPTTLVVVQDMGAKNPLAERLRAVIADGTVEDAQAWCVRAGLSKGFLSSFFVRAGEDEEAAMHSSSLQKLADAAGLSLAWLQTGHGPRSAGPVVELDDPYPTRADAIARLRGVVSDEAISSVRAVQNLGGLTVQEWVEELIRADRLRSKLVVDSVRHSGGGAVGMPSKLPKRPRS